MMPHDVNALVGDCFHSRKSYVSKSNNIILAKYMIKTDYVFFLFLETEISERSDTISLALLHSANAPKKYTQLTPKSPLYYHVALL